MKELRTISFQSNEEEVGGELGCYIACAVICIATYMNGAAMGIAITEF